VPLNNPITEPQLPQAIARDSEFQANDTAHVGATNPHNQYMLKADLGGLKVVLLQGMTPGVASGSRSIPHNLPAPSTSLSVVGFLVSVRHNAVDGGAINPRYTATAGYEFDAALTSTGITVFTTATNSQNIYSKPVNVVIFYT